MADTTLAGALLLEEAFEKAKKEGRAALMPYMMGGFPNRDTALAVADAYWRSGADIIEVGVPFSDPLADGAVIHEAAVAALRNGTTFESVMDLAIEAAHAIPVVLMIYANMVINRDPVEFARYLGDNGVAGLIVPDLPPEEGSVLRDSIAREGLALIPLIAPTTPPGRRAEICREASGFVYVVSDTRTTGERDEMPPELGDLVRAVQADAPVPAAVGFGIGTPEQAAEVGAVADGVIVGSRLVREVGEASNAGAAAAAVGDFISAAREAMSRSAVG